MEGTLKASPGHGWISGLQLKHCETWWHSHGHPCRVCPGPTGWHLIPHMCQPHQSSWCHPCIFSCIWGFFDGLNNWVWFCSGLSKQGLQRLWGRMKEELGWKSDMCRSVGRVGLPGDWFGNSTYEDCYWLQLGTVPFSLFTPLWFNKPFKILRSEVLLLTMHKADAISGNWCNKRQSHHFVHEPLAFCHAPSTMLIFYCSQ